MNLNEISELQKIAAIAPNSKTSTALRVFIAEKAEEITATTNSKESKNMSDFDTYIANLEAKGLHQAAARARKTGPTTTNNGMHTMTCQHRDVNNKRDCFDKFLGNASTGNCCSKHNA